MSKKYMAVELDRSSQDILLNKEVSLSEINEFFRLYFFQLIESDEDRFFPTKEQLKALKALPIGLSEDSILWLIRDLQNTLRTLGVIGKTVIGGETYITTHNFHSFSRPSTLLLTQLF